LNACIHRDIQYVPNTRKFFIANACTWSHILLHGNNFGLKEVFN
jgi:hypothetical protein